MANKKKWVSALQLINDELPSPRKRNKVIMLYTSFFGGQLQMA